MEKEQAAIRRAFLPKIRKFFNPAGKRLTCLLFHDKIYDCISIVLILACIFVLCYCTQDR